MAEKKRVFSDMKGQMADPEQIFCRNCAFRDKTEIKIGEKVIKVGVTKGQCDIYVYPNKKPSEILFQEAPCDYWAIDKEVGDG